MRQEHDTHQNRAAEAESATVYGAHDSNPSGPNWLEMARFAYDDSTTFVNADLRLQWERNLRTFNNRHPSGSKYYSDDYKHRSKLFRPKTRSTIRKGEAQAAAAYFSTQDVVSIAPEDDTDPVQLASAAFWHADMNYRLENSIPWYLTCMGAYQSAQVMGSCVSKVFWEYEERKVGKAETYTNPDTGEEYQETATEIVKDRPAIRSIPLENVRFDRAADWIDPVNTSPYFIELIPMHVGDAKARMKADDPKTGQPKWKQVDDAILLRATTQEYDSTRQAREGYQRRDSKESGRPIRDHEIIWIHDVIIRHEGKDWQYYTVGTEAMLSEPKPLVEVYPHTKDGKRPFVVGYALLEAFRSSPSGKPELLEGLQQEANEIVNQRIDNVKLSMNGRPLVRAGKGIDLNAVKRHIPGAPILVRNVEDIKWDRPPDVTQSSYAEQDRINVDYDELAGSFSTGSVQSNRKLNETVGGMQLLAGEAGEIGEYDLRTFNETWVEPILKQLLALLQTHETDVNILALAGNKAKMVQKFGIDELTDEILNAQLTVSVSAGMGSTDPARKMAKLQSAIAMSNDLVLGMLGPDMGPKMINVEEQLNEIWGAAGHRDASRFYNFGEDDDPQKQQMQEAIDQLQQAFQESQQALESQEAERQHDREVAEISASSDQADMNIKSQELDIKSQELRLKEFEANAKAREPQEEPGAEWVRDRQLANDKMNFEASENAKDRQVELAKTIIIKTEDKGDEEATETPESVETPGDVESAAALAMEKAAELIAAPKRVIRGENGLIVGIETVTPSQVETVTQ